MTKSEWINRCAKAYVNGSGVDETTALSLAESTLEAQGEEYDINDTIWNPEECAEEDMRCWTDDGGD